MFVLIVTTLWLTATVPGPPAFALMTPYNQPFGSKTKCEAAATALKSTATATAVKASGGTFDVLCLAL